MFDYNFLPLHFNWLFGIVSIGRRTVRLFIITKIIFRVVILIDVVVVIVVLVFV